MTSRGNPRPNSPAQGQSRHQSQAPGFCRQCVGTGIRTARVGCRLRPSRAPHEVAPIHPEVHRHDRDGPRQRRLIPGVRRHHGGPRQGTGGRGSDADEDRAPKDREARPKSIDERHSAAVVRSCAATILSLGAWRTNLSPVPMAGRSNSLDRRPVPRPVTDLDAERRESVAVVEPALDAGEPPATAEVPVHVLRVSTVHAHVHPRWNLMPEPVRPDNAGPGLSDRHSVRHQQ